MCVLLCVSTVSKWASFLFLGTVNCGQSLFFLNLNYFVYFSLRSSLEMFCFLGGGGVILFGKPWKRNQISDSKRPWSSWSHKWWKMSAATFKIWNSLIVKNQFKTKLNHIFKQEYVPDYVILKETFQFLFFTLVLQSRLNFVCIIKNLNIYF